MLHLLLLIALYFLPTIVAHSRRSTSTVGIFIVNLLFGWTGIGWIVTLFWAVLSASWNDRWYRQQYYDAQYYGPRYPARW